MMNQQRGVYNYTEMPATTSTFRVILISIQFLKDNFVFTNILVRRIVLSMTKLNLYKIPECIVETNIRASNTNTWVKVRVGEWH